MVIVEIEVEDIDEVFSTVLKQEKNKKKTNQLSMDKLKGILKQAQYASEWGILFKGYIQKDKELWIKKDCSKIRRAMNVLAAEKFGIHISDIKVIEQKDIT